MKMTRMELNQYMMDESLTINEMAECLDVTPQAVGQWLHGKRKVPTWLGQIIHYFIDQDRDLRELKSPCPLDQ